MQMRRNSIVGALQLRLFYTNSTPPPLYSVAYMRQWIASVFGLDNGLSLIRRQAII